MFASGWYLGLSRGNSGAGAAASATSPAAKKDAQSPATATAPAADKRQSAADAALTALRGWFIGVGVFSAVVNLLMLTGALYMLQVYDRVLMSRSVPTLIALSGLALVAFGVQGLLDSIRMRMLVNIGAGYEMRLAGPAFDAVGGLALGGANTFQAGQPARDIDRVRTFLSGMGPTAILDMPFMPLFMLGCFILHPWLGYLALAGGAAIILLTVVAEYVSKRHSTKAMPQANERASVMEAARRNAEVLAAMGFRHCIRQRWIEASQASVASNVEASGRTASIGAWAKTLRLVLQSAMLGLGGYLAINTQISAGAIIAASILMSRALAPIELAVGQWRHFVAARESHVRLRKLLAAGNLGRGRTSLPAPKREISVEGLHVTAQAGKTLIVKNVSFTVKAGSALALFGPSAAGKSTLARALVGAWRPAIGHVRLDGADVTQFPEQEIGRHVGYLPQDVELLDGTIAENIARFDPDASSEQVVDAAIKAGAHEIILRLPEGYDTRIGEGGVRLSGGQRQRVAVARALFRDPFLVVLDEPNSNLDGNGEQALNAAITSVRERGGVVIAITHRPSLMAAVDYVGIMKDGTLDEFGPKEKVVPKLMPGAARAAGSEARPAQRALQG